MTFLRRLFGLRAPARSNPSPQGRIAAAFREWSEGHGLRVLAQTGLRISGRLGGRDVVIDPGLDGAHPGWVVVTISVALPSVQPIFVTRVSPTPDFATARIRALFDDVDLGAELRAISVGPHHVRLRLAPGTSPRIVEQAVHAVGDAMRTIHVSPESEPRHSCTTTVPYPS
jgi:hypothetical protein